MQLYISIKETRDMTEIYIISHILIQEDFFVILYLEKYIFHIGILKKYILKV